MLCERADVRLGEQSLPVHLDEQDSLDRRRSVGVDDVVRGREVLDQDRQHRHQLVFSELE